MKSTQSIERLARRCRPTALFALTTLVLVSAILPASASAQVVISQVFGGGGNSGSPYPNDFVELFNTSGTAVNLANWSLHYGSANTTGWSRTILNAASCVGGNCVVPAQSYFLVRFALGTCAPNPFPAHDATGTTNLGRDSGKVALVANANTLPAGRCPVSPDLVDFIGYGEGTQMCAESEIPTPKLANDTSALRLSRGCDDTDNNRSDFFLHNPNPRNRTMESFCTVQAVLSIHDIQGAGTDSPYVGMIVETDAVVTARTDTGFFIQVPDELVDGNPATSEAIRVDTGGPPPAKVAVGNLVTVAGRVEERVSQFDTFSPPVTVLWGSVSVSLIDTGQPLPKPITITAVDTDPNGSIQQLERLEHMRVSVASLTTTSGTAGRLDEDSATSTSFGSFFARITGLERTFREPGIEADDPIPMPPCCIPRFDGNPERLRLDTKSQGLTPLEVTTDTVLTNVTGPLDYVFRTYTIVTDTTPSVSGGMTAQPLGLPGANRFRVASFNMRRFFDTVKDPALPDDEPVLTPAAYDNRLRKASLVTRTYLRYPDIIGVQELEHIGVLTDIANRINADAVAGGDPNLLYQARLIEGNDFGGIDVGFLVKTARVSITDVTQFGAGDTFMSPPPCPRTSTTHDRPPLVLRAQVDRPGADPFPVTVIVNHLRSFFGISDPVDGPWVRAKRHRQAEFLANLIQARQTLDPKERIIVLGDFNAYPFNDGFVDSIGTIKGDPTGSDFVLVSSNDLVEPDLALLEDSVPEQRYTYVFNGNAQAIDHVLATQNMADTVPLRLTARLMADFPQSLGDDPMGPERFTDHDIPVVDFTFPPE